MTKKVKCFICGKELEISGYNENDDPTIIQSLHDGLWFRSSGNYGSTIFDPMDEQYLEIPICDQCVLNKKYEATHIHSIRRKSIAKAKPFNPFEGHK